MRGLAMPKRRRRSRSTIRSVASSFARVMARGTSARARWVVASATRRPPPTSIITTSGVRVRSARYSVCPVNAMPASFNTLFCTGAVTIASNSPLMQPSSARSRSASTCFALRGSSLPAVTGAATGMCTTLLASNGMPRARARAAITSRSPRIARRPANFSRAMSAHRSGPMPAGSPAVSATRGESALVVAVLDEGAVARLAQPVLVRLVGLARADRGARGGALALLGELLGAPAEHLHEVPSERRLDRLAHLVLLERVHHLLELRHRVARGDPAQVAALERARVLRLGARELGEIRAADDLLAHHAQALARFGVRQAFARAQQDVAHVRLLHAGGRDLAALLEQLHDVEAVGAAQDVAHVVGLHLVERLEEERGQARRGAPAEVAALERVGRIRIGRGDLREVGAAAQLRERGHRAAAARLDLLWRGLRRHQHEDVREAILRFARSLARLARDLGVHLGIGHDDVVLDFTLAQPRHQHLVADVVAEALVLDVVALERGAEVRHRQVVLLRDALDGAVEGRVVDLDARLLRHLHLHEVVDHALEDLARERVRGRDLAALARELAHDQVHAVVQVVLRDHLVVHDRDDAVHGDDGGAGAERGERDRGGSDETMDGGVHSGGISSARRYPEIFCRIVSSGLMPILESPESSSWIWNEVEYVFVVVMKRWATARTCQQPALYSKPASPSTSLRSLVLQFQRPSAVTLRST